jgi:putative ABC transport system permease protein
MLQNYFKIAWRNFVRDKQFSLLNLTGLSVGLACTLLIYLWVDDELQVDRFHEKDSQLFQVMVKGQSGNGISVATQTPAPLADALAKEMPEVEYATAIQPSFSGKYTLSAGEKVTKATGLYVSKDYFNVFSWHLLQGNKDQVLADKGSVVLSKAMALQLFGTTQNVVGKKVDWQHDKQLLVSGIVDAPPANSSIQFDFLLPFELFLDANAYEKEWGNSDPSTYVVLKAGANVEQFNNKIADFLKTKRKKTKSTLLVRHFSDGYLYGSYENGVQSGGRIAYVKLVSVIALFILIIACINFMNLSTAKASKRMKEVGIRKCVGASRTTLVFQYLGESMLLAFCSLVVATILVTFLLPYFGEVTGKRLSIYAGIGIIIPFLAITLFTGLLAGSYPALYLSGFNPVAVLKGKLKNSVGELWVRKGLVVFQFTLSVVFIIAAIVVYQQIAFIQTKDKGFNKDNIISFSAEGMKEENMNTFLAGIETFIAEAKNTPGVLDASSMDHGSIVGDYGTTGDINWTDKKPEANISFGNIGINYSLIETLGMKMAAGRSFSRQLSSDSSEIIFNETAIKAMGLTDPIGKTVHMWDKDRKIVGIVKDFHYESLHENVRPFAFRLEPLLTYRFVVKIKGGMEQSTVAVLQKLYQQYYPGFAFDYQFLDQDYQAQYTAERQVAQLSLWFTGLTILICVLGLFGLAAFNAERRFKEIGIRKVLGATVGSVVMMLSKDFLKLVLAAILIAFPLAWLATNQWLNGFAYRIQPGGTVFVAGGALMLGITLLTISFQSIKAALANPVKSLKME